MIFFNIFIDWSSPSLIYFMTFGLFSVAHTRAHALSHLMCWEKPSLWGLTLVFLLSNFGYVGEYLAKALQCPKYLTKDQKRVLQKFVNTHSPTFVLTVKKLVLNLNFQHLISVT